ncbi:MAG TPA: Hsp70 family protein [Pyrinomonadaceae bacterium]|nr:Hsp70 family protein [Pyrinomonadaceae bacterium]
MLLGIDFGTTRTVVAAADRGNYPVVSFQGEHGDPQEWYPSLIACARRGAERLYGFDAAAVQHDADWSLLRSFKRELGRLGPESSVRLGDTDVPALQLLSEFLEKLRTDLRERSNLHLGPDERLETVVTVPANANSNQRYLTLEAFRLAGFHVRATLNEPSAAGVEYAHRYLKASRASAARENVVVYDLGGGTFDASVISMADQRHEVLSSDGVTRLGGDDFDQILLELALAQAGIEELPSDARAALLEECREKKEGLHPNTRKVAVDLGRALAGAGEVLVPTADFYERCRPLVERTIEALERAVTASGVDWGSVASVYMVGGSSDLPAVARTLRERYSRLVRRSPYPHAATAIGAGIAADSSAGYRLSERFTRHFGVWREAEQGRAVVLDVIFEKETPLPTGGSEKLVRARRYRPAHNLGHFRFVECSRVDDTGQPTGDITPWDEIFFPFAPELQHETRLAHVPVTRTPPGEHLVEEVYSCDEHGIIEVRLVNHATRHERRFMLRTAGA